MANSKRSIELFLASQAFGVVGVSNDRNKFGNKVLRCYLQNKKKVYPVSLKEQMIENIICVGHIRELPIEVQSLSIITPPAITEQLVMQAINQGIKNIWIQPGAESEIAIKNCKMHHINVIAKGPCILVELGFKY